MRRILIPVMFTVLGSSVGCTSPMNEVGDEHSIPSGEVEFSTAGQEKLAQLFGDYGTLDAETGEWMIDAPPAELESLVEKALTIAEMEGISFDQPDVAIPGAPETTEIDSEVVSKSQAQSLGVVLTELQNACYGGNGNIHVEGVNYAASSVRYRFKLKRNGSEIDSKEIKTCGDQLWCQPPFTQFFPSQAGSYTVSQIIHAKYAFLWIKVGEYDSNALTMGSPSCPRGNYDGANCFVGKPPSGTEPFVYGGNLYYSPLPSCPMGTFDGANCFIGHPPTKPFIYNGHLYYGDVGGSCPIAGSWFDGANCFVAPSHMDPFIYNGNLYVSGDASTNCPMSGSAYDGANCYVYSPPQGSKGFIYNGGLYYGAQWSCR